METVCEKDKCVGCMACVDICTQNAISIQDDLSMYNAIIDEDKCIHCGICHKICQNNLILEAQKPIAWYQGWAEDLNIRKKSSSGGFAAAISKAFVEDGGAVYSCCFAHGEFRFMKATNNQEVSKFAGSKYVKSNPQGVYNAIRIDLRAGRKVLFIGLPCQAAALINYIGKCKCDNLYIVDLICHGTPSPKLLNLFLKQYNKSLDTMKDIVFREKAKMQIYGDHKGITTKGVSDRYTIAFLNGLIYTKNCYECHYAKIDRISDITLGDSWGTEMSVDEKRAGISLALCQTEKGVKLLSSAKVTLFDVSLEKAIANNQQLSHPSYMPENRKNFFSALENGMQFNQQVRKFYPKQCFKQNIKEMLIKVGILDGGDP